MYSIRLSLPRSRGRGRIYVASDNRPRHLWSVAWSLTLDDRNMLAIIIMLMMTMMMMNVYDGYDYDDDYGDYYDYHDDESDDDFYYDDDGYDDGMLGSMVQVFEVATNTAACTTASPADPRGSATNSRCSTPANTLPTV